MPSSPRSRTSRRNTSACRKAAHTSPITTGTKVKIACMGAGGVGGYFGARLQQAGHDVTFIARGRHLAALQKEGLSLRSPLGDARLKVKAVENPTDAGAADVVLFAVKLWDTETAAEQLRPVAGSSTLLIPFH